MRRQLTEQPSVLTEVLTVSGLTKRSVNESPSTIRLVCGLLRQDAGSVTIAGVPGGGATIGVRAQVGYAPQEVALYSDLSALC